MRDRGDWCYPSDGYSALRWSQARRVATSIRARQIRDGFRSEWERNRTLYGKSWEDCFCAAFEEDLEAHGHASPARIPPRDLALGVARGGFGRR